MKHAFCGLAVFTLVMGVGGLSGCGKTDEQRPRFNESLGGSPPISIGHVDRGILQDPAAYKPANLPAGVTMEGDDSAAGASGSGGEADAVRAALKGGLEAAASGDFLTALDSIVPEQIAALRIDAVESAIRDTKTTIDSLNRTVMSKAGEQYAAQMATQAALVPEFVAALTQSLKIEVLDAENATASIDPARFQENMQSLMEKALTMMTPPGGAPQAATGGDTLAPAGGGRHRVASPPPEAPPPAGAAPGAVSPEALQQGLAQLATGVAAISIPLKKVDGAWRIDIHHTISPEEAELVAEGLQVVKSFFQRLTDKADAMNPFDPAAFQAMAQQTAMEFVPQAMALWARFQALHASEKPEAKSPEKPAEEEPAGNPRSVQP